MAPDYEYKTLGGANLKLTPNYEVPTAPKLENYEDTVWKPAKSSPPSVSNKSFEKWPDIVTAEDFQVQALEREILRAQEKHLAQRLEIMERLIQPRAFDKVGDTKYDTRQFEYLCFPYKIRDPNYPADYHSLYIQKDKVMQREHQLAEFYRRLEHHPYIYALGGVQEHAEKDFKESAAYPVVLQEAVTLMHIRQKKRESEKLGRQPEGEGWTPSASNLK